MATRSVIGVITKRGIVASYCHYDGYLDGVGDMLVEHYKDEKKILELLKLGSLSYLAEEVTPRGEHSFEDPEEGVTVAYGRDRGEEDVEPEVIKYSKKDTLESIIQKIYKDYMGIEYVYLYVPKIKKWLAYYHTENGAKFVEVATRKEYSEKEPKKLKITREESVDFAREMRKNKLKQYKIMAKNGRLIMVSLENDVREKQGFSKVVEVNWTNMGDAVKENNPTQKQVADFLYHYFNGKRL